jgi:hypothetical protein
MTKKSFIFWLSGAALLIGFMLTGCGSAPAAEASKDKDTEKGKPAMETTLGKSLSELTQLLHPLELQDLGNGQYVVKGYPLEGQLCIFAFSNGKSTQCELILADDQFEMLTDSTIKQSGEPSTKEENQWTWNKPGLSVYVYRKAVEGGTMTGLGMHLVQVSLAGTWKGTNKNGVTWEYQFDDQGGGTYKVFNPNGSLRLDSQKATYTKTAITEYFGHLASDGQQYVMDAGSAKFTLTKQSGDKVVFSKVQ